MAKILGYQTYPVSGLGAGLADLFPGLSQDAIGAVARNAAQSALPVIEEKINEKLIIAGAVAAVGFAGLGLLIWKTRAV